MAAVPTCRMLRHMLCLALESYLPSLVAYIERSIHVYSGSARKYAGHFKLASRVAIVGRDSDAGRWQMIHPFSMLRGFVGVDGALLTPVALGRAEDWPGIEGELDALEDEVLTNRVAAGLHLQAIPPVSHSTDTYGKHALKLRRFYSHKYRAYQVHVSAPTPRANAELAVTSASPQVCPTVITGEPQHDVCAFRRLISSSANDCRNLLSDHECAMSLLSAPCAPTVADVSAPAELLVFAPTLLKSAIKRHRPECLAQMRQHPDATEAIKVFLGQANVRKAATWETLFGAVPPAGTLSRLWSIASVVLVLPCLRSWEYGLL
jgi:hypothetical protein